MRRAAAPCFGGMGGLNGIADILAIGAGGMGDIGALMAKAWIRISAIWARLLPPDKKLLRMIKVDLRERFARVGHDVTQLLRPCCTIRAIGH